jgi:hypothetical protein
MYGKWALKRLQEHINILSAPDSIRSDSTEKLINLMSGNAAMAEIGFNVASYLAQYPQSAAGFMGHVSLGQYLGSALEYLKNHRLFNEMVKEKSTVMRRRVINYAQEYIKKLEADGKLKGARLKLAQAAMKMQEIVDWQTVSIGWWAVYQKEVNSNGGNEEAAIARADEVVLDTQPNMEETELSPLYRRGPGGLPKALVRYGVPLNTVWNQLTYPLASIAGGGLPNAIKNGTVQQLVGVYTAFGLANALVALIQGQFHDDDDDTEDKLRLLAYYVMASPLAESMPLVSNIISPVIRSAFTGKREPIYPLKLTPMLEVAADAGMKWNAGLNEEDRKKREKLFESAMWDTIYTGMYGFGLPANQVKKFKTASEEESFWPVIGFRP